MSYFYCYDGQMMRKLQGKNIRYITRALTIDKHQKFWLYAINEEFQQALEEIKQLKI
ncbi:MULTISPECIES: hypothetical protein [Paenibacillus]|uniref:hypothetical protein n=1 Tax=Paenibacillus TaxID=44249 RepID=UPI000AFC2E3D|nr:hypothetical protein [Paenibacillus polymyxa]